VNECSFKKFLFCISSDFNLSIETSLLLELSSFKNVILKDLGICMGQFLLRVVKDELITDYELFQAWVNCVTNSRPLCQIERNNDDISLKLPYY
jgi:hypothetical protein